MERISKITKFYILAGIQYRVELESMFDFSGFCITICNSIRDIYDSTKHIVFCNGN